jgi:hypothetical protein
VFVKSNNNSPMVIDGVNSLELMEFTNRCKHPFFHSHSEQK